MINIERRSGNDRRKNTHRIISRHRLIGRRRHLRRKEDRKYPQLIDRYSAKLLPIIMGILFLSIMDALFTLILVGRGAEELNPVLAYFLGISPWHFIWIKYLLTSLSVLLVVLCKDSYIFKTKLKARILLFFLPVPFLIVIPWQLGLIFLR
ncbi:conserved membrane hypothetical protein [uncultured Desulfobacterium sp.]|uniref:DUF5658 domain-containing protein n=1 Tax=uncultured Desulfobacterium sp. TaxID=201089 RepID=A0A445N2Y8_9BACT|nr:conserved membrane hypothetical protein [uncultured Desulfobacterium sp.]